MYTYRNRKTGAAFSSPCPCAGDDWEEVSAGGQSEKESGASKSVKKSGKKNLEDKKNPEAIPDDNGDGDGG